MERRCILYKQKSLFEIGLKLPLKALQFLYRERKVTLAALLLALKQHIMNLIGWTHWSEYNYRGAIPYCPSFNAIIASLLLGIQRQTNDYAEDAYQVLINLTIPVIFIVAMNTY